MNFWQINQKCKNSSKKVAIVKSVLELFFASPFRWKQLKLKTFIIEFTLGMHCKMQWTSGWHSCRGWGWKRKKRREKKVKVVMNMFYESALKWNHSSFYIVHLWWAHLKAIKQCPFSSCLPLFATGNNSPLPVSQLTTHSGNFSHLKQGKKIWK